MPLERLSLERVQHASENAFFAMDPKINFCGEVLMPVESQVDRGITRSKFFCVVDSWRVPPPPSPTLLGN